MKSNNKKKKDAEKGGDEDSKKKDSGPCNHMLFVTKDLGKTFTLVTSYVVQFAWAPIPDPAEESPVPSTSSDGSVSPLDSGTPSPSLLSSGLKSHPSHIPTHGVHDRPFSV